jgi:tRNA pseudouridine55 synthase
MSAEITSGVIFLDKPEGWTSRQAVNAVSRIFGGIKVGHSGTLDPLATGMLPVLLGEATKFADLGLAADKIYRVTLDLSLQTDTLDAEGTVTQRFSVSDIDAARIRAAIGKLEGRQLQIPPAYSAIRLAGRRAYELARQGRAVTLPPREISIHWIRLTAWDRPVLKLHVKCSKGAFIRSLARDVGELLGTGGCVTELRRTCIGSWEESLMVDMKSLEQERERAIQPLSFWLKDLKKVQLTTELAKRFLYGQRLPVGLAKSELCRVYCNEILLGAGEVRKSDQSGAYILHPKRVLPSSQRRFV